MASDSQTQALMVKASLFERMPAACIVALVLTDTMPTAMPGTIIQHAYYTFKPASTIVTAVCAGKAAAAAQPSVATA